MSQDYLRKRIIPIDRISKIPIKAVETHLSKIEQLKKEITLLESEIEKEIEKAILGEETKND